MNETWSIRLSEWKQESLVKSANETARAHLDKIDTDNLRNELLHYLYGLINDGGDGAYCVQSKRAEGPEDYPVLLAAVETAKRNKARIRAISLEAGKFLKIANDYHKLVKKALTLKQEYQELKNAEQREAVISLVASDVIELKTVLEDIIAMAIQTGKEYNDAFNSIELEYRIVNSMSYHRNLYEGAGNPRQILR